MNRNSKLPKTLGSRIQKLRRNSNLTQEELAEKVGISRAYMGYIEQGRNTPSIEVLQKISSRLRVPLQQLFS
jgi:transcriptional regulator with XRE-family HTH domain